MEIALAVLSIISLSFMIAYIAVVKKLNNVSEAFSKLLIVYNMTLDDAKDSQRFESSPEDMDTHKENFIKFLSDSRDWAFDYIENVQTELQKFINNVEPSLKHFDEFGIVVEGMPLHKDMQVISDNFKELKKLLPEEINDRR